MAKYWLDIKPKDLQLRANRTDCLFWLQTLDVNANVKKKFPRRADKVVGNDLFDMLWHWLPKVKLDADDPALAAWLTQQMKSKGVFDLRRKTVGDAEKAALAAIRLYQELNRPHSSVIKTLTKMKDNLDTVEAAQGEGDEENLAADAIKDMQQLVGEKIEGESVSTQGYDKSGHEADMKDAQALQAMNEAAKVVAEDLDDVAEFASILAPSRGFDLNDQSSRFLHLGLNENLMRTIKGQEEFRRILQAAGRLRLMAGEIKSRKPKPSATPIGVTQGDSVASMLPQEIAMLSDPDTEPLFYQKYLDHSLLMYDRKQRVKEGKGPIVCLLDVSGSMMGTNERNAKAFFLQMVRTAREQKRKAVFIPFATNAGDPLFIESYEDLLQVILPHRYNNLGGGTDFDQALAKGVKVIENEGTYKAADIVMLSDGESRVTALMQERVLEAKKTLGFKLLGVLFSGRWKKDMKSLLDLGVNCDNRGSLDWAEDLMERVI